MLLFSLGKACTVLVLGLPPKRLHTIYREHIHINTSYNSYIGNVGRHNYPLLGPNVLAGNPYGARSPISGWAMTLIPYVTFRPK
jgi:hypothetical protein